MVPPFPENLPAAQPLGIVGGAGGGGGGAPPSYENKVILSGKAYPFAKITILMDGRVLDLATADNLANFKKEISNLTPGVYTFSIWAEDKEGRRSITLSFAVTILQGVTTNVSGIFLPPTIELNKVNLNKGEILNIFGQTAPEAKVTISIESPNPIELIASAIKTGDWQYLFNTSPLSEDRHTVRAKAEALDGLKSSFSTVLAFYIGKYQESEVCPGADFNKDGRVNLIDFSIMLYWWGKYNPCVDLNHDGIVNLPDFSILMYYWTG